MIDGQIDCIVRLHDPSRLLELQRCIFSLVGQNQGLLRVILVTQRFSLDELHRVRSVLEPVLAIPDAPTLEIRNWNSAVPRDARTELLNLGLEAATGRYLAFLDYDDTLFPEAYEILLRRLRSSGAGVAFASVRPVKADMFLHFVHVKAHKAPYAGKGVTDLFRGNFCPIHSYLIDRWKVPSDILRFDTALSWEEDYDFLLRLCASVSADFGALEHIIGDYYFKNDGSNTIWSAEVLSMEKARAYEYVASRIEMRRLRTILAPEVQQSILGKNEERQPLTIRMLLDHLDARRRVSH